MKGLVEFPLSIAYPELKERPSTSAIVTLECVGNTVAGESISTAEWQGLSLRSLLNEARVSPSAYDVVFRAAMREVVLTVASSVHPLCW